MMSAQGTLTNPQPKSLYLAFELSQSKWKLGFSTGLEETTRICNIAGGDLESLEQEIEKAKGKLGICEHGPIISCYEAGRDGFWLHRYLCSQGIENWIVDSASIEAYRRGRRAKTDRLDVGILLTMLIRFDLVEQEVWRTVNAPTVSEEDWRHLHRELKTLKKERTGHINRIKGLLTIQWNSSFADAARIRR